MATMGEIAGLAKLLARSDVSVDDTQWWSFSVEERREVLALFIYELEGIAEQRERKKRAKAQRRARGLLRTFLNDAQKRDLDSRGAFFVEGSAGGMYRLYPSVGHAELVVKHGTRFYAKTSFCLHDEKGDNKMPFADVTIAHLFMLRSDEPNFLGLSNHKNRRDNLWNPDYLRTLRENRTRSQGNPPDRRPDEADHPL